MNVAVYTLTRDRLEYTQRSFASLQANAHYPYTHYVVDNGSTDGTPDWLATEDVWFKPLQTNVGISHASNMAVEAILADPSVQLIIKMDNDCLVRTPGLLAEVATLYGRDWGGVDDRFVTSPRVSGINNQPYRDHEVDFNGRRLGVTSIVGGLFHIVPRPVYEQYRYPEHLPLAWGQDDDFCDWVIRSGRTVGYLEDLEVEHMDGTDAQAQRYPEYFERKFREEQRPPG